ncbi:MAG: lipid A export permease/ATP-binding protein MsbA [Candidatus Lightella neohaematopini]|nr:lipid A export permease/ATP-binding protein MsbA [Candidatus Lightella neohaematopini]
MLKNNTTTWQTFSRFWCMVYPFKIKLVIAMIALVVSAISNAYMISLLKPIFDHSFVITNNSSIIWWVPFTIIGLSLLRSGSNFIANYCIVWVSSKIVMNIRKMLFTHIMSMPVSFFDTKPTSKLLSYITYVAEQVAATSSSVLINIIRDGTLIMLLCCMMFYYSPLLSTILLVLTPCIFLTNKFVSNKSKIISKEMQYAMEQVIHSTEQMLKGHKEILMYGGQNIENKRFYYVSNFMRQQEIKMVITASLSDILIQLITSLALATILYIISFPIISKTITAGTITVVFSSMIALIRPIKSLTNINTQFQKGMTACKTIFSILDIKSENNHPIIYTKNIEGNIIFNDVTFTYPTNNNPSLYNITFNIPAGSKVALVGHSGAGKSTIAYLLTRFYNIESGSITIDGTNLYDYNISSLRNQISLISQNIYLFNDTIANNISYANKNLCSRKQIEIVADMAYVMDFVKNMDDGLDTIIGENGILLSSGQRQCIAIARAFLKNSSIIILDEATSALDVKTELNIQQALHVLKKNCTLLIIAHRLSTIEDVDEILVIKNGKIIERGNHKKLISSQGLYAQMCHIQYN